MADDETPPAPGNTARGARARGIATDARAVADRAVETVGQTFDNRPLSAVGGALALGAVVAAVLPATRREADLVGPLGDRMRTSLEDALKAAREAGSGELTAAGLTFAAATNGLGGVAGSLAKAALSASGAAATSVRKPRPIAIDQEPRAAE